MVGENKIMFRCQYCKTSIFFDFTSRAWSSVTSNLCVGKRLIHQPHQSAEFYRFKDGYEELISSQNFMLIRNGEMRLKTKTGETLHYSDQVLKFGITTDDELAQVYFTDYVEIINNPWFEILDRYDGDDWGETYDDLDKGLEALFQKQGELDKNKELYETYALHISRGLDEAMAVIDEARHTSSS
jgi:hypothetical protein